MSKDLFTEEREKESISNIDNIISTPTSTFKFERPIAFIDIESTGPKPDYDRIVELSIVKLFPDFSRVIKTWRINPGIAIPAEAVAVHGITFNQVRDCLKFIDRAKEIMEFLSDDKGLLDVAGFSSNSFDIPLLYMEFHRAQMCWEYTQFHMIDVGNLFKIKEQRTLSAAVRFYLGRDHEGAHGAEADIQATIDVFVAQLHTYNDLPESVADMALFTNYGKPILDLSGKFYLGEDGHIYLNFGVHKDKKAKDNLDYVKWMYTKGNFAPDTYRVCASLLGLSKSK